MSTMERQVSFDGRVAIVTGAGRGLGRSHALALAARGAKVLVNDLSPQAAESVCEEIRALGGAAVAHSADVTDYNAVQTMGATAVERLGDVSILVNNAGILRDKTFANMAMSDFRLVVEVHLMGSVNCTKMVWDGMRARRFGRIVFTTSSSGLYGNFGQANYAAAKMALVGLMQTLALEGERYGIRVNALAPSAATEMTNGLYDSEVLAGLDADAVSPAVIALCADDAPTKTILLAGGGAFAQAHISMTRGLYLGDSGDVAVELVERMGDLAARDGETVPRSGAEQHQQEIAWRNAVRGQPSGRSERG